MTTINMEIKELYLRLLFFALLFHTGIKANAYDIAVKNADGVIIYYNFINDGTELEVCNGNFYYGNIVIPEEVTYMNRTKKVTRIGNRAFWECTSLYSITIPNTVKSIGIRAFWECTSLLEVTIPDSVTTIDEGAFSGCTSLSTVTLGSSITKLGNGIFSFCISLSSVTSKMEHPCTVSLDCFTHYTYYNSTLHVPDGCLLNYKNTSNWNKFLYIE